MEGVVESRKRESGEEAIAAVMAVEGAFVRVWDVEVREEEVLSAVSAIPVLFGGGGPKGNCRFGGCDLHCVFAIP